MVLPTLEHISLLGVRIHKATTTDIVNIVHEFIMHNSRHIIANHNLHSVFLYHNNAHSKMARFYHRATYTFIDGMSLVFFGHLLGHSLQAENRLTMLDLIPTILNHSAINNWRTYYLGTKQEIGEKGINILTKNINGLNIRFHNGFFNAEHDSHDNANILQSINEYRPHILLVGMGMPRQEEWIIDNFEQLIVNVIFNTGAYMDYIAGDKPIPPRWLGPLGLEWLYRLMCEPRRLGQRYMIEPWLLLGLLIKKSFHNLSL